MEKILKRYFNLKININEASFENLNIGPNLSPFMDKDIIKKFCDEFNKASLDFFNINIDVEEEDEDDEDFEVEIALFVKLLLFIDKSYIFIIKGPAFSFFLQFLISADTYYLETTKFITLIELYYIFLIKNYFINKFIDFNNKFLLKNQVRNMFFGIKNLRIN